MPTCVSLFSGVGGLDYGLEQAGFDIVMANEICPGAVDTYKANICRMNPPREGRPETFGGCRVIEKDIRQLAEKDELLPYMGVDLVAGGPPCQPFSSAGKQLGLEDERGSLYREFARVVSVIRPRAVLLENVRGLVTARGLTNRPGEILESLIAEFESLGYGTSVGLLNAADFGVPQRRVRFFLLGILGGRGPEFPQPTHGKDGRPQPWVPLSSILFPEDKLIRWTDDKGRERCEAKYANEVQQAQLSKVEVGKGVRSNGRAEPTRPGGHWGYKQGMFVADPALPARTITASATQDWIRLPDGRHRRLIQREAVLAQGFPLKWDFHPNAAAFWRQVGNAVPPAFGKILGEVIIKALDGHVPGEASSRPLPSYITSAITYTVRDWLRNGSARPRAKRGGEDVDRGEAEAVPAEV